MARHRLALCGILALYLAIAMLFAAFTPAWQAPDEPAHFNYVRALAEDMALPVLRVGDYPHATLEALKSAGFPPGASIDAIRYEFHQPPLYYLLAAPVHLVSGGSLFALRMLSVVMGAGIVLLAYGIARRTLLGRPGMALAAAAFVAFLPQHMATVAQVGNDVLAELLVAALLFILVGWVRAEGAPAGPGPWLVGLLLGLALVTKTTAAIAAPLVLVALIVRWRRGRAGAGRIARDVLAVAVPALVIALPWAARNAWTYGWPDVLGLQQHDAIVVGQARTADWLAANGWPALVRRAIEWTFKSFWGVFGWMGVWLDSRIYFGLALVSAVAAGGWLVRALRRVAGGDAVQQTPRVDRNAVRLLAACALLALLAYVGYNLTFLQHQGRYLFTALIPVAIAFAYGWRAALEPLGSRLIAALLAAGAAAAAVSGVLGGDGLPVWPLAMTAALAVVLAATSFLPSRLRDLAFAAPFLALPVLALYALFGAIVPQLAR